MQNGKNNTQDREMRLTRILDAPIELVWEVITRPNHVAQWWGPDGFTITISKMDVIPGGEWNLVMHGPDGTDYDNKIIFKEVEDQKKLVLEYQTTPKHLTTVELETKGNQTIMRWHMTFESKEQLVRLVREFQVDKGLQQNVEKWNRYLVALQTQEQQLSR